MKIGVFTALWGNLSFEEALDKAADAGLQAVGWFSSKAI